ncbi:MAG: hypothetical protein ABI130_15525 [Leifsonia sp.]
MRRVVGVLAGLLLGLTLVSSSLHPAETEASWAGSSFATGSAASGSLNAVPTVTCGASSGLIAVSIPINWTAPATGGNAVAPTGYRVDYSGTAGSGSQTTTARTANIPGGTLAVAGTMTVKVYATYGNWVSPVSLQTRTITATLSLLVVIAWTCT